MEGGDAVTTVLAFFAVIVGAGLVMLAGWVAAMMLIGFLDDRRARRGGGR